MKKKVFLQGKSASTCKDQHGFCLEMKPSSLNRASRTQSGFDLSLPNNYLLLLLVPKKDSWVLREGAPYVSSKICFEAEGTPSTLDLHQLFSSVSSPPSFFSCHPYCKLLEGHKENLSRNKAYVRPSAGVITGTAKEVKELEEYEEFPSYLDLEWLSNSQVCCFDNESLIRNN